MLWDNNETLKKGASLGSWVPQEVAERYALKRGYTWLTSTSPDVFNDWLPFRFDAMLFTHHQAVQIADRLNRVRPPMMPIVEVVKLV